MASSHDFSYSSFMGGRALRCEHVYIMEIYKNVEHLFLLPSYTECFKDVYCFQLGIQPSRSQSIVLLGLSLLKYLHFTQVIKISMCKFHATKWLNYTDMEKRIIAL